jgi:hypothetical protein
LGCSYRPRCRHAFETCTQVPALEPRRSPLHLDACWLEPSAKAERRAGAVGEQEPPG